MYIFQENSPRNPFVIFIYESKKKISLEITDDFFLITPGNSSSFLMIDSWIQLNQYALGAPKLKGKQRLMAWFHACGLKVTKT